MHPAARRPDGRDRLAPRLVWPAVHRQLGGHQRQLGGRCRALRRHVSAGGRRRKAPLQPASQPATCRPWRACIVSEAGAAAAGGSNPSQSRSQQARLTCLPPPARSAVPAQHAARVRPGHLPLLHRRPELLQGQGAKARQAQRAQRRRLGQRHGLPQEREQLACLGSIQRLTPLGAWPEEGGPLPRGMPAPPHPGLEQRARPAPLQPAPVAPPSCRSPGRRPTWRGRTRGPTRRPSPAPRRTWGRCPPRSSSPPAGSPTRVRAPPPASRTTFIIPEPAACAPWGGLGWKQSGAGKAG